MYFEAYIALCFVMSFSWFPSTSQLGNSVLPLHLDVRLTSCMHLLILSWHLSESFGKPLLFNHVFPCRTHI